MNRARRYLTRNSYRFHTHQKRKSLHQENLKINGNLEHH
jgi:hypothetical protein